MSREVHVRFCKGLGVKSPGATYPSGGHHKLRGIGLKELPSLRSGLLLDPYTAPLNSFAMSNARNLDADC